MQHLTAFDANSLGAALQELIPTGIFDTVESVFGDLYCTKNNNQIVQFIKRDTAWIFKPYLNATTEASGNHASLQELPFVDGYLCAQGIYLITGQYGGEVSHIIITKGSNGQCVSLVGREYSSVDLTIPNPYYVTSYGDDTSLNLYSYGYRVPGTTLSSGVADRTQLLKIPICGQMGSTDYVDKCRAILLRQYSDPGVVEIDGTKYFCLNRFAIVDE